MDVFIAFLALLALCLYLSELKGANSAFTPLLALCFAALWFGIFGVFNALVLGGWLFYSLCFGLGFWAFLKNGKSALKKLLSPGFLLFCLVCLVLMLYFKIRQPVFTQWDEYSSWGLAAKTTKLNNLLYPIAPNGFWWTMTEHPALIMLTYFAQFFGAFAAWKVYWVYAALYAACIGVLLGLFKWRHWRTAVPVAVAGLVVPFFFSQAYQTVQTSKTWLSAYGDLPGGLLFGACLCVYFAACARRGTGLWQVLPVLAALALVKENVMPIALVAAGLFFADQVLFGKKRQNGTSFGAFWAKKLLWGGAFFAAVLLPYFAWKQYGLFANSLNPYMNGNKTNAAQGAGILQALKETFGLAPKSEPFNRILKEIINNFLGRVPAAGGYENGIIKVSMAGTGLSTLILTLFLFILAALFCKEKRKKTRIAFAGGFLLLGYLAYHFMLFVVYAFLSHTKSQGTFDYPRYTSSFTSGWFMLGLMFCGICAIWGTKNGNIFVLNSAFTGFFARVAVLLLAVAMLFRTSYMLRPGYSVLDFPPDTFAKEKTQEALAEEIKKDIEPGGRVFFVCQKGDGSEYFLWHYYLQPIVATYSITGGQALRPPQNGEDESYLNVASPQKFARYLEENGCNYILIESIDQVFIDNYGFVFSSIKEENTAALYKLEENGLYSKCVF